jgi:hypothetical protein
LIDLSFNRLANAASDLEVVYSSKVLFNNSIA